MVRRGGGAKERDFHLQKQKITTQYGSLLRINLSLQNPTPTHTEKMKQKHLTCCEISLLRGGGKRRNAKRSTQS